MASYKISWRNSAKKEVRKMEKKDRLAVLEEVEALSKKPRKQGVVKLTNSEHSYRRRVGNYRIIFEILDDILTIEIVRVKHRKEAYR